MVTYAVYRKPSGENFFNPAQQSYNVSTPNPDRVGGIVNDCECIYVGDLETAERITAQANAQLPQATIDDLL